MDRIQDGTSYYRLMDAPMGGAGEGANGMAEHNVTSDELYRLIQSMDKKLDRMHSDMVGRKEYEADQEGIERRFQNSDAIHNQLDSKVAAVDAKHAAELKDIRSSLAAAEKDQRQNKSKWTLAMVTAVVGAVLSVIAGIALQGGAG